MITWNLAVTLCSFALFGINAQFELFLYSFVPGPMAEMYNETASKHYGIYLDSIGISGVVSAISLLQNGGALASILLILPLMDTKGRKFVVLYVRCLISSLAALLQILSFLLPSAELFILSMFFAGMGMQIKMAATLLFVSECSPDQHRGAVIMFLFIGESLARLTMSTLCRPSVFGNENWVWIPSIALLLSILLLISNLRIPDSPIWLVSKGKDARKAIEFYRGKDVDSDELIYQMKLEAKLKSVDSVTFREVWRNEISRQVLITLLVFVASYTTLAPFNLEMYYPVIIYQQIGLSVEQTMTMQTILGFIEFPIGVLGIYLVDRAGRRQLYFLATLLISIKCVLMIFGLGVAMSLGVSLITQIIAIVNQLITGMLVGTGVQVVDSILICELLPPVYRVKVAQLLLLGTMVLAVPMNAIQPLILNMFLPSLYILFLICQPICALYIHRNLVETKNRPLYDVVEEIDEVIKSRSATVMSLGLPNTRSSLINSADIKKYQSMLYEQTF